MKKIVSLGIVLCLAVGATRAAQSQGILINIDCFPEGDECPFIVHPDPVGVEVGSLVQWVVGSTCNVEPCLTLHPNGYTVDIPGMGYNSGPIFPPNGVTPVLVVPQVPPGTYPYTVSGSQINGSLIIPNPCPWDLDGDGRVTVRDLLLVVRNFGACADPSNCPQDFDNDGLIGVSDLLALIGNFGPCP